MIISCDNCNKKFEVDDSLIPEAGRLLQCSSCLHKWHFVPKKKKKKDKIIKKDEKEEIVIEKIFDEPAKEVNDEIEEDTLITEDIKESYEKNINKSKKNKSIPFINILLVLIITFIAILTVVETFKFQIIDFYPELEFYLNSFYETIKDITSFIQDLFKFS